MSICLYEYLWTKKLPNGSYIMPLPFRNRRVSPINKMQAEIAPMLDKKIEADSELKLE